MSRPTKPMEQRKAWLIGLDCRDRFLKLCAAVREEYPDLPDEELLVALDYTRAHVLVAATAKASGEAISAALKKHAEDNYDEDDDEEENDDEAT